MSDAKFFFFSDDIEWAKQNMDFNLDTTFVEPNVEKPVQDLWLMTLCRHRILSKSSFSWWSAWLSKSKDGVVIAPKSGLEAGRTGLPPCLNGR